MKEIVGDWASLPTRVLSIVCQVFIFLPGKGGRSAGVDLFSSPSRPSGSVTEAPTLPAPPTGALIEGLDS